MGTQKVTERIPVRHKACGHISLRNPRSSKSEVHCKNCNHFGSLPDAPAFEYLTITEVPAVLNHYGSMLESIKEVLQRERTRGGLDAEALAIINATEKVCNNSINGVAK